MSTEVTTSTGRADTSRINGRKSVGPVSCDGKATSAMNNVQHGLASHAVLLPSETTADYQANITAWAATLQPSSPGEVELVARVADLNFRLRRLRRLEDRHLNASLDGKLKETGVLKMLGIAQNASLGMAAMITTVGDIKTGCSGAYLAKLLSPISAVVAMVNAVDLPVAVTVPMDALYVELEAQTEAELVPPETFTRLIEIGGTVVGALNAKIVDLQARVVTERERIADDLLLGDDKELLKFERHRARISKALDAELARLKIVRELSHGAVGSSVGPILVELKVIGRRE